MSDTITLIFYKGTRAANPHARRRPRTVDFNFPVLEQKL